MYHFSSLNFFLCQSMALFLIKVTNVTGQGLYISTCLSSSTYIKTFIFTPFSLCSLSQYHHDCQGEVEKEKVKTTTTKWLASGPENVTLTSMSWICVMMMLYVVLTWIDDIAWLLEKFQSFCSCGSILQLFLDHLSVSEMYLIKSSHPFNQLKKQQ